MLSRLLGDCTRSNHLRAFILPSLRQFSRTSGNAARGFGNRYAQQGFAVRERVGPTLREKLLGPTTGKPFIYGTYALAGASVMGIGLLCYYGLGMSKEASIMSQSALWPQHVRDRLRSTYGYLAASLAVTAASGVAASRSYTIMRLMASGSVITTFAALAVIVGSGVIAQAIDYDNTVLKHAAWLTHAGLFGAMLAPLCFLGGPVLLRAAWYTAGIVAGLSFTAISAPSEKFLMMSGPLAMGLGVVFVANIGTFFLPPGSALGAGLASLVVYGGLILFSMFLLHDTQRVVKLAEKYPVRGQTPAYYSYGNYGYGAQDVQQFRRFDPINAQMAIYLDILNIFIRMAMIMGGMGGNRRRR
uniref:Growth hormone-inducible transmembrane protein n=2 Tax=Ascaris TaxID=6251 RepID=A0A9J2Q1V2_ASCLU